jgi:hypothetical protein
MCEVRAFSIGARGGVEPPHPFDHMKTAVKQTLSCSTCQRFSRLVVVSTVSPPTTPMDGATKLPNPKLILSQLEIGEGNKQVAHGIDAVLLLMNS